LYTLGELSRRARSGPHENDALFISYLIDVVGAILQAPVSDETRRLLRERAHARTLRLATSAEAGFEGGSGWWTEDV
jgi:hypothetical protein